MDNTNRTLDQKAIALQLSRDLVVLRDAMTHLALSIQDYVFECSGKNDQTTSVAVRSVIDKAKSTESPS